MAAAAFLPVVAAGLSGAAGLLVGSSLARGLRIRRRPTRAPDIQLAEGLSAADAFCMRQMIVRSKQIAARTVRPSVPAHMLSGPRKRFASLVRGAGPSVGVTADGYVDTMVRFAFGGAALLGLLGCMVSNELGLLGLVGGLVLGAAAPRRALRSLVRVRLLDLERGLSEMLEVVALGVRSGLSFDRSLELYTGHFDSRLARECAAAQRSWSFGLASREEALKALAASYDSPLFSRTVSSVVRSLRFGTALGECLEQAAAEARAERRARVEERVAKAPVKMMVPTGTLILPAMLILVLGPVLLELMGGI